jgi:hypothetical protein
MRSLDICQQCGSGRMLAYKSKTVGQNRTRYLRCSHCSARGKEILRVDALGRPEYADTRAGILVQNFERVIG